MELITCVSTAEALKAAVTAGTDGIRVGLKGFSARGLPLEELKKAAQYCRVRGVSLSVSMEKGIRSEQLREAADAASELYRQGVTAVTAGDIGFLRALRLLLPELRLEAAPELLVSDAMGAKTLQAIGVSRLLLPPQLAKDEIRHLCRKSGMEIEVTVCSDFTCPALGRCRMSAFAGAGGANPTCGRECREHFQCSGESEEKRPAMKGVLLAEELPELSELGVRAVSLHCEAGKPEFAAMAADIFFRALRDGKTPSTRDLQLLNRTFLTAGASNALYLGKPQEALLSAKTERKWPGLGKSSVLGSVRAEYSGGEFQRVPVEFRAEVVRGSFSRITVTDGDGHSAGATGPIPLQAGGNRRELTAAILRTQLFNTLGTPFLCREAAVQVEPGLHLSSADVGHMRREALNRLAELRSEAPPVKMGELPGLMQDAGRSGPPDITVSVLQAAQLTEALAALRPKVVYVPLEELLREPKAVTPFWENGETSVCAILPGRFTAAEAPELYTNLKKLKDLHVEEVLAENVNELLPAGIMGFRLRCGLGLQAWNEWTLRVYKELGAVSATLSAELPLASLKAVSKRVDTELYAYGRIPLLTSEAGLLRPGCGSDTLRDRKGRQFPASDSMGRSVLYSPDKLFLGDRMKDLQELGLWCLRLAFTTENPAECVSVTERYLGLNSYMPNFRTKGLYYETETNAGFRFSKKTGAAGNAGRL